MEKSNEKSLDDKIKDFRDLSRRIEYETERYGVSLDNNLGYHIELAKLIRQKYDNK
jgi:hypothetical protein